MQASVQATRRTGGAPTHVAGVPYKWVVAFVIVFSAFMIALDATSVKFISLMQARLVARGMDLVTAHHTAMLGVIRLVRQQAYALALQDGYRLTFWLIIPAILAVLLIPYQRVTRTKETKGEPGAKGAREEALSLA